MLTVDMGEVMTISTLRHKLSELDPGMVFPLGFGHPHSWRGSYDEPAVQPCENVTVTEMMETLDLLVTETFTGWKGGLFSFGKYQDLHIDWEGFGNDELVGPVMWDLMLTLARIRAGEKFQEPEGSEEEIAMADKRIVHVLKRPNGDMSAWPTAVPTAEEAELINALDAVLEVMRLITDSSKVQEAYDGLLSQLFEVMRPGLMISMTAVEK